MRLLLLLLPVAPAIHAASTARLLLLSLLLPHLLQQLSPLMLLFALINTPASVRTAHG
jgi:hypothetical protein